LFPYTVETALLLERVQEFVNGTVLRRGQREVLSLELLALQALDVKRRSLVPWLYILHGL
jgi:hypothetical protein